jgi:sugar phosphate isomerase/epimerase
MTGNFRLAIITDEISNDFEAVLHLAKAEGLDGVELRGMWQRNLLELPDSEVEEVRRLTEQYDLPVVSIAAPFLKCHLETDGKAEGDTFIQGEKSYEEHLKLFDRALELAELFGCRMTRTFSFWRIKDKTDEELWPAIAPKLAGPLEKATKHGVWVILENEPAVNTVVGASSWRLWRYMRDQSYDIRALRLLWDPGNELYAGELPYPDGFDNLNKLMAHDGKTFAGMVAHMHIKDGNRRWEEGEPKVDPQPPGQGEANFTRLIPAIVQSGYRGWLSLEPHYRPAELVAQGEAGMFEAGRRCIRSFKAVLGG